MSHSASGPCLVCGEETTSRCEACRQAGIDLFFCSREHQKLVWYAHKLVCGPGKANPFLWPEFSPIEAEQVLANLDTPHTSPGLPTCRAFFSSMIPNLDTALPVELLPSPFFPSFFEYVSRTLADPQDLIRKLVSGQTEQADPPFSSTRLGQFLLFQCRVDEADRCQYFLPHPDVSVVLRCAAFFSVRLFAGPHGISSTPFALPAHVSLVNHRLLALAAVTQRARYESAYKEVLELANKAALDVVEREVDGNAMRKLAGLVSSTGGDSKGGAKNGK